MIQLPTYSKNKMKGNTAADILKKVLGHFSIVTSIDESVDLGIDMRAQLVDNQKPEPLFFNIQCKGKDSLSSDCIKTEYFSIPIKIKTINYWNQQNDTTLLFVVDNETENCYWCDPLAQILNRIPQIQNQQSVSIQVPLSECINSSYDKCPPQIVKVIMLFMVNQLENINKNIANLKNGTLSVYPFDIETSVYLLKRINEGAKRITESYQVICETIIANIKNQMREAYDYVLQLEVLDPMIVHKWCPNGVRTDHEFTNNHKSLADLQLECEMIINTFLANKSDTNILDDLIQCDKDIEDLLINLGAFLYEMACEDNPFGDNSELYKKTWGHKWKYHKSLDDTIL
ncbi:MAG: DUF4365 domain-containing protein [Lachnospira sp.]|nr:DUF4365 domain-containing protein [Lachnospira sp.]